MSRCVQFRKPARRVQSSAAPAVSRLVQRVPGTRGLAPLTGWDAWYERERELPPQHNLGF